jgi:hypothetical protein
MAVRLVALDEGPDISLDRAMVVVGRHPACDARLDSLRISRHHCCLYLEGGQVSVRDLGSTNGIRINGQRVEVGRLRSGDELSIAHIRYRLEENEPDEMTLADLQGGHTPIPRSVGLAKSSGSTVIPAESSPAASTADENALAAAVRKLLPAGVADKCKIQVIVEMAPERSPVGDTNGTSSSAPSANQESLSECHSDSSH